MSPAWRCGVGQSLALPGPRAPSGDLGQAGGSPIPIPPQPGPPGPLTRGNASVSEASKLFRRWMRYRCGGSRTDSGTLTLGESGSGDTLPGPPGDRGATAPGPSSPPWALSASSGAAAPQLPPRRLPARATHLTCAGSARVPGPRWSRGLLHNRQGVPGSEGTRNRRRLTR